MVNLIIHILIVTNIYIILSVSTGYLTGLSNLLSLGQAAFYGIGAYLAALALKVLGFPLGLSLLFSFFGTGIIAISFGYLALKLKGDFFTLATIGFQIIVYSILYNWVAVTGGPYGVIAIPRPEILGLLQLKTNTAFLILSLIMCVFSCFVVYRMTWHTFGRSLIAIRDDEISMLALGRNIPRYKLQSFVFTSAFAAIAGFIYAGYITYIDPTGFNIDESIFIITAVLIGGVGNLRGPILGAIFVVVLPEILRFVGLPNEIAASMRLIIYGLSIILFMRFRPQGIAGNYTY